VRQIPAKEKLTGKLQQELFAILDNPFHLFASFLAGVKLRTIQ
jgi:hypothetical protein